jgi:glycine dehydrogenase subunit 1
MRYLPTTPDDRQDMLSAIGVPSIDALYEDVPASARLTDLIDLPLGKGELAVERDMRQLSRQSLAAGDAAFFVGAGAYRHHVPASVDHLIQRSEFLTAYTPYQPEISQGTLQYLFEFQTQVAMLTGMEVANASMYDGATSCAEAVLMATRATRRKKAILSGALHPHYRDVTQTTVKFTNLSIVAAPAGFADQEDLAAEIDDQTACVVVQNPDVFGRLHDLTDLAAAAHEKGALLIVAVTEILSLGAVKSPGEMGADIVVGEGQSIGNGLNFGGPYLGLFSTRQKFTRQMPGRLCGETVDATGKRGYVLTLSTREQHIRREKATSNICTNAGLCSLAFSIHASLLGEKGLKGLALLNHRMAQKTAARLATIDGVEVLNSSFFNEFTVRLKKPATAVVEGLAAQEVLAGVPLSRLFPDQEAAKNLLLIATTETNTEDDIETLAQALAGAI